MNPEEVLNSCINFTENENKKVILILTFPLYKNQHAINDEMTYCKDKNQFFKVICRKSDISG